MARKPLRKNRATFYSCLQTQPKHMKFSCYSHKIKIYKTYKLWSSPFDFVISAKKGWLWFWVQLNAGPFFTLGLKNFNFKEFFRIFFSTLLHCNTQVIDDYLNSLANIINWKLKLKTSCLGKTEKHKYLDWLCVLIMSRMFFREIPHYIVAWISRNFLFEAGAKSEV